MISENNITGGSCLSALQLRVKNSLAVQMGLRVCGGEKDGGRQASSMEIIQKHTSANTIG